MQPVIDLGVTRESPAQYFALQLRQLDLLIGDGVVRSHAGLLECDLVVLPAEVAQRESARGREVIERPMAAAFELGDPVAQVMPAGNRCRLREIDVRLVLCVDPGIAEIADTPGGLERGPAGVPLQ